MRKYAAAAVLAGSLLAGGCTTAAPGANTAPSAASTTTAGATPTQSATTRVENAAFSTLLPAPAEGWTVDKTLTNDNRLFYEKGSIAAGNYRSLRAEKSDPANPQTLKENADNYATFIASTSQPVATWAAATGKLTFKVTGQKDLTVHGWPARQIDSVALMGGKEVWQNRFIAFTIPGTPGVFDVNLSSPAATFAVDAKYIDLIINNFTPKN